MSASPRRIAQEQTFPAEDPWCSLHMQEWCTTCLKSHVDSSSARCCPAAIHRQRIHLGIPSLGVLSQSRVATISNMAEPVTSPRSEEPNVAHVEAIGTDVDDVKADGPCQIDL